MIYLIEQKTIFNISCIFQDYAMETGATRLFETRRLCATLEQQEKEQMEAEAKKEFVI